MDVGREPDGVWLLTEGRRDDGEAREIRVVVVAAGEDAGDWQDATCAITITPNPPSADGHTFTGALRGTPATMVLRFPTDPAAALRPGSYRVRARISTGERTIDRLGWVDVPDDGVPHLESSEGGT